MVGTYAAVDDESRAQAFGERTRQRCWSAEADVTGYPVIVKSSAGGGGIGVNKCATPLELREAFDSITVDIWCFRSSRIKESLSRSPWKTRDMLKFRLLVMGMD